MLLLLEGRTVIYELLRAVAKTAMLTVFRSSLRHAACETERAIAQMAGTTQQAFFSVLSDGALVVRGANCGQRTAFSSPYRIMSSSASSSAAAARAAGDSRPPRPKEEDEEQLWARQWRLLSQRTASTQHYTDADIEQIQSRIFGTHIGNGLPSGRKVLRKKLQGERIANYYPEWITGKEDPLYVDEDIERCPLPPPFPCMRGLLGLATVSGRALRA